MLDNMQELAESEKLAIAGSRSAVELTLPSTNLTHTGTYTCVADNGFQRVSEDVSLTVYPQGLSQYCSAPLNTVSMADSITTTATTISALFTQKIWQHTRVKGETIELLYCIYIPLIYCSISLMCPT